MTTRYSRSPWRAVWNIRRRWWEILNGRRDPVAAAINTKPDAELMAASPRLLGSLKHMVAIVRMHEADLRASERAKLDAAVALVNELNGSAK